MRYFFVIFLLSTFFLSSKGLEAGELSRGLISSIMSTDYHSSYPCNEELTKSLEKKIKSTEEVFQIIIAWRIVHLPIK